MKRYSIYFAVAIFAFAVGVTARILLQSSEGRGDKSAVLSYLPPQELAVARASDSIEPDRGSHLRGFAISSGDQLTRRVPGIALMGALRCPTALW